MVQQNTNILETTTQKAALNQFRRYAHHNLLELLQRMPSAGIFTTILCSSCMLYQHKRCLSVLSHQRMRFLITHVELWYQNKLFCFKE
ncbi:hypothetical protein T4B_11251 [Trichinella pseudospiralis]|uniref:Uncharacterized protein n=1 Tax=Trichinella pseudospiralis TaxID=6337 RepID=A0A0V1I345_TRIPS|nr:hypothetical protein T4A_7243 [Trichinella pseudospiralis]KRZ17212.1 hypothetical protein T4B_11251 [Trichinella pseudospiralis]KRZ40547.1 hypothetical protein T4C_649 [Trichinella pseudospiralis]